MKKQKSSLAKFFTITSFIFVILISTLTIFAAGETDPTFNAAAYRFPSGGNPPMKAQPDGKLLIAFFEFGVSNGVAAQGISRFNPDGTLDASFNAPRLASGSVRSIALQSNGKILLRGEFAIENSPYEDLARLNADGSLDTTFNIITTPLPHDLFKIFVQPDDSFFTGTVYKFDADGIPDPAFQYQPYVAPAQAIAGLSDGRIYVSYEVPMSSGINVLARHNADGTRDESFSTVLTHGRILKIITLPDGKLLIAGGVGLISSTPMSGVARLNSDGSLDSTFNPGGTGVDNSLHDMEVLPDGKILIGGYFEQYNGVTRRRVARLNPDGTLDTSFTYTGSITQQVVVRDLEVFPDGKIVVAGENLLSDQQLRAAFIITNSDGSQIPGYFIQTAVPQRVRKTAVQSDGKILVAGEFQVINGYLRKSLARLNADGTIDTSFVPFFNSQTGATIIHQVLVQPDGKILVSFSNNFVVARLNPDGTRDMSFNIILPSSMVIYDFALQADGKILLAGEVSLGGPPIFSRLNSDGTVDSSFNPPVPNAAVYRVLAQPDGKIIIGGDFTQIAGLTRNRMARYNADGTLDNAFDPSANGGIYDMDLQADGKIIVGGAFSAINGNPQSSKIGRLNADGTLDTSFAQNVDTIVQTVKAQPDGKILIGGSFTNVGGTPRERLARLNPNGSLDLTFNASANALIFDINLQADGKILVAGDFSTLNNAAKLGVARLNNSASLGKLFDFDGDGKTDVGIYRPSAGEWWYLRSSDGGNRAFQFGSSADNIVPADYTGDSKTDIAFFRPSTGEWFVIRSEDNSFYSFPFGTSGDIPTPADFDGDGTADVAIFRPTTATWFIIRSSDGGTTITTFGANGDQPVAADYDGDGFADVAIFRPSDGSWWINRSSAGLIVTNFGTSSDKTVQADYTGDGKTDVAIFRPSTGEWFILRSEDSSFYSVPFGTIGDIPAPGDYDGDGAADYAVFRPSNATWYVQQSTNGFAAVGFGATGDQPVPNAFVR